MSHLMFSDKKIYIDLPCSLLQGAGSYPIHAALPRQEANLDLHALELGAAL